MRIFLTLCILTIASALKSQVKISGVVKNYNDTVFYISETGGFHNFTRVWRDNRVKVTIDKSQHFKITIPEETIGDWYIKTEKGNQFFRFIKGQYLELIADFSQKTPLYAIGKNADDFNYSVYEKEGIDNYHLNEKFLEKIRNNNIDSVLRYRKALADFKKAHLNKYRNSHKLSDIYYRWLHSRYSYEPFERTLVENIKKKDSVDDVTVSKIMEKGIKDEYAALNTPEYNDLVDFYVLTRINSQRNRNFTLNNRFSFVADNDIIAGNTKDVYLSRFMAWLFKTPDSIYSTLFKKYDKIVRNKEMKQYVINRRKDYTSPLVSSTIDNSSASSINEIFKKYKGKVIYVDFWASWCVPCRNEMPNAAILKDKLKGEGIVFLYFGYNDKETAWMKARNQLGIEGEHYLLNEKMIKAVDELFGINGIPHYAIIDKEGKIVSKRADRPSDVYQQLVNLVKK